jgi:metal-responsive CopG/Arc/MetJ family transcriptional regulator
MAIAVDIAMKTVQMTLDEDLVAEVDAAARELGTTRSAFARDALRAAMARLKERELERRHRAGYRKKPVRKGEFSAWEGQQAWGE